MNESENFANGINVFPNPAQDYVMVSSNSSFDGLFELLGTDGSLLITHKIQLQEGMPEKIDLTKINSGIYILKLNNNRTTVHKVILVS